jgi:hypothetical protein
MTPEDATSLHALVQVFQARRGRTVVLIADDEDQDATREHRGPPRPAVIIPFPEAKSSGSDRRR